MPNCAKCQFKYPATIVIDGKRRNLANRSYCLTCSPFGEHNTRRIEQPPAEKLSITRSCTVCNKDFQINNHGSRGLVCGSCKVAKRRWKIKRQAVEYKGGKCLKCGYDRCLRALQFHHRESDKKEFVISRGTYSWERIKIELDKCDLLCSNCHVELHDGKVAVRF